MPVLLGCAVSDGPDKAVISRSGGTGYAMANEEAVLGLRYGADRRHYLFMDAAWPPNANTSLGRVSGHAEADYERNRLPIVSHKVPGFTWAQVGAATSTVNPGAYDMIVARGGEIAAWQAARAGQGKWGRTFIWTHHHEPNNDISANGGTLAIAAANWRAATQNIYNLWVSEGVQIWSGTENFATTTEGMILAVDMISGHVSQGHDIETWWGPATADADTLPGDSWMDAHVVMHAGDHYNRGPLFQRWSYSSQYFKQWSDAKHVYQTAQGRPFMTAIWETGCQVASAYTGTHSSWDATGLAATPENWLLDLLAYNKSNWPYLDLFCYWDSTGQFSYELDNTLSYWNTVLGVFADPYFANAATPLPTASPTELGMVW